MSRLPKICIQLSAVMFADDLLLLSTLKVGLSKQIEAVENYGKEHGIVFNLDKTELIIINRKVKRSNSEKLKDD